MIFLAFPLLHVEYIMQFLFGVLEVGVKGLHELPLESVNVVLNVARHSGVEGLALSATDGVRVGRLGRLFHENTRACARE